MKFLKFFVIIILIISNKISISQEKGTYRICGITEITSYNSNFLSSYGISIQYFVNKYFSLNYHYSFGMNQNHKLYSHFNGSLIAFAELLKVNNYYSIDADNDGMAYLMLLSLIIPEGISFHTYPREWFEIAPFVNPLIADYNILNNKKSTLTLSVGMRTYFNPTNRVAISPHFGIKYIYSVKDVCYLYGFSIGYSF